MYFYVIPEISGKIKLLSKTWKEEKFKIFSNFMTFTFGTETVRSFSGESKSMYDNWICGLLK